MTDRHLIEGSNMKRRTMVNAASANRAAREVLLSAAPSIWTSHRVDRTRSLATIQNRIVAASVDSSNEFHTIALECWENEGGRVSGQSDVASARSPMK